MSSMTLLNLLAPKEPTLSSMSSIYWSSKNGSYSSSESLDEKLEKEYA